MGAAATGRTTGRTRTGFGTRRDVLLFVDKVAVEIRLNATTIHVFGRATGKHQVVGFAEVAGRIQEIGVGKRTIARGAPAGKQQGPIGTKTPP